MVLGAIAGYRNIASGHQGAKTQGLVGVQNQVDTINIDFSSH